MKGCMNWISVKDRLPEEPEQVLVGYITVYGKPAWWQGYWNGERFEEDGVGMQNVTHWMHVDLPPTPPEEDKP